jgi:NDP-sugar pyrophosphorylase family protein
MKGMIFAAGRGTRLGPLTGDRPKALVEIGGRTLLEIAIERLRTSGVTELIVNVHHFADMIVDYLERHGRFGMRVEISPEETLLDTGGGLKQAGWFFLEDPTRLDEPFIVHNVDVVSTIDLERMVRFHREFGADATLAVQQRTTSRYLVFDGDRRFRGRYHASDRTSRPEGLDVRAFAGIHVVSPRLLPRIQETGAFSIIDAYQSLVERGAKVLGFPADEYRWRDVGTPESLAALSGLVNPEG